MNIFQTPVKGSFNIIGRIEPKVAKEGWIFFIWRHTIWDARTKRLGLGKIGPAVWTFIFLIKVDVEWFGEGGSVAERRRDSYRKGNEGGRLHFVWVSQWVSSEDIVLVEVRLSYFELRG